MNTEQDTATGRDALPYIDQADAAFFDPASQDHFESVDDQICPEMLTVALPGHTEAGLRLQCEIEGEHDGHEATLRWTTEAKETEDG